MLVKHVIRTISKQNPATGRYNFPGIKNTNINNIAATTITNFSIKQCNNNNNNNNTLIIILLYFYFNYCLMVVVMIMVM